MHLKLSWTSFCLDNFISSRNGQHDTDDDNGDWPDVEFEHFDKIMPEKKTHEVKEMSKLVQHLCLQNDSKFLVDLGKHWSRLMNTYLQY